jgi:hypothetical protein
VFIAAPAEFVSAGDRPGAADISLFGIFSNAVMALPQRFGKSIESHGIKYLSGGLRAKAWSCGDGATQPTNFCIPNCRHVEKLRGTGAAICGNFARNRGLGEKSDATVANVARASSGWLSARNARSEHRGYGCQCTG